MELLIGCPVWKRDWIVDRWMDHAVAACNVAGVDCSFVLFGDASDTETISVLGTVGACHEATKTTFVTVCEDQVREDERLWDRGRIAHLVILRNWLLEWVRGAEPELFLSLDSDILLHPNAVYSLLEAQSSMRADAVGGKCYLSPTGHHVVSYANLPTPHSLHRPDTDIVMAVDALMAIKLMTPAAYNVDYRWHHFGEDVGWALNCQKQRLRLFFDGRVTSKHVWSPDHLGRVDPRCGY